MSDDSLSKITQTHESRMTPVCFGGLTDQNIVICERGLWQSLKGSGFISEYLAKSETEITQTHES